VDAITFSKLGVVELDWDKLAKGELGGDGLKEGLEGTLT